MIATKREASGSFPFFCAKASDMAQAFIALEDGSIFWGQSVGAQGISSGEICFNTGMTGYQEIYTDPSYYGQVIANTSSHIGNYGTKADEVESGKVMIKGLIVKSFSEVAARQNADQSLQHYLLEAGIVGVANIDTRKLVRQIREKGVMNVVVSSEPEQANRLAYWFGQTPSMAGLELASHVSTPQPYFFGEPDAAFKVAVIDYGIKRNILRMMASKGIYCQVFPAQTSVEQLLAWNPDGFFLSNGPGDPAAMDYAIETTNALISHGRPLFGICLGHQIIARASGLATFKMHHGHRGLNHPVKNLLTGKAEITSQNHGFAVKNDLGEASRAVEVTHLHLNDGTVAGLRLKDQPVFSVQYHPEASPGPHDSHYLFDQFAEMMANQRS